MKTNLPGMLILLVLAAWESWQQACTSSFTAVSVQSSNFCVKCDVTCATCFDDTVAGCVTCRADFALNPDTRICIPPNNNLIKTVDNDYRYYQFTPVGTWLASGSLNCNFMTILLPQSTTIGMQYQVTPHYKIRVMVSIWRISDPSIPILLSVYGADTPVGASGAVFYTQTMPTGEVSPNSTTYCVGSSAVNFDSGQQNSDGSPAIYVEFSSSSSSTWGIREYVLIQYNCYAATCSKCDGPDWDDCLACTDSTKRRIYTSGISGPCLCKVEAGYFRHPDVDVCVKPCPNQPSVGQFYGDPTTHSCKLVCPTDAAKTYGVYFADDTTNECVQTCPAQITLGGQAYDYYHDITNKRCVVNCPSTEPYRYKNGADRRCLASCPPTYYKLDSTMTCQTYCPNTQTIVLYKDDVLGACVADCEGADWWGDPVSWKCTATCFVDIPNDIFYFEDNTTTINRCVQICPAPLYFGDKPLGKCIDQCYGGRFGDTHPLYKRQCVNTCNGGYFGLLTGNRACVPICPNQTWGNSQTWRCVQTTAACTTPGFINYADNYTRKCVARGSCSLGQFSTDVDYKCMIDCPSGTYANIQTKHCELTCSTVTVLGVTTTVFADPGANKCVPVCESPNLFGQLDTSGNKCVALCDQTKAKKFRDESTRLCVDVCPDNPYTFADPDEQSCVYNCSIGLYAHVDVPNSKKYCIDKCPVGFYGDNSTGYGNCVARCPENPPLFGDTVDGFRVCVAVCNSTFFGDQDPNNGRLCVSRCPSDTYVSYGQADNLRRCVARCNTSTYGDITTNLCVYPQACPGLEAGDPFSGLCTTNCPSSQGTFADLIVSFQCVSRCPINNSLLYFADPGDRYCKSICPVGTNLFGNNRTQTCETECLDSASYADFIHDKRYCIANCSDHVDGGGTTLAVYYRNNFTKKCVVSADCPTDYFGENVTRLCVASCPKVSGVQTWGHIATKVCISKCYGSLWGDASTGVAICVSLCPALPPKWSHQPSKLCVSICPANEDLWGEDYTRTCTGTCPMHPSIVGKYTFAYNITRRCLEECPRSFFADWQAKMCWSNPFNCTTGWGDPYNNSCTALCTATPWDSYGDDLTGLCTTRCSVGTWADNVTGTRRCVGTCPGAYDIQGVPLNTTRDTYGDNSTQACLPRCVTPGTWADWQTNKCETRCTGDDLAKIPTYSQDVLGKCRIALSCPELPDKLFGDNNTRACVTKCYYNSTYTQWADNITRTCIPQCYRITNASNGVTTRFYGDLSTNAPVCVVICPETPRLFGQNSTNRCVAQCPDNEYGDQTGNRSCVPTCPRFGIVIWFRQINHQLCVLVCEEGTWGTVHEAPDNLGPKCVTVPTDCIDGEYADNSTDLCVPLCPEDQNYFGDPSTRLCVDRCPNLLLPVSNATAGISMIAGRLFADYKTRLCVYTCPADFGPAGTWGDNFTNTCVQRCPDGTYGDAQHPNRHCVVECTDGTFADNLTNTCIKQCPSSPPYFADLVNKMCVKVCPDGTWASSENRTCVSTCPPSQYRLTDDVNECVSVCPADPDLYADPETKDCVSSCQDGHSHPFADPTDRTCKPSCGSLFEYNYTCVSRCPFGLYANTTGNCILAIECAPLFADNSTSTCVDPCPVNSYADPNSQYCIAICPLGWFSEGAACVQNCAAGNASTLTQACMSNCPNYTYAQNSTCKNACTYGYANDETRTCANGCPATPVRLFASPVGMRCVATCDDDQSNDTLDYYKDTVNFVCVLDCSPKFKDFISGECRQKCSNGYWGNRNNHTCTTGCPEGQYGFEDTNRRTCYPPNDPFITTHPTMYFADTVSREFVTVCPITPVLYFGDRYQHLCVDECSNVSGSWTFGDPVTRQCETTCTNVNTYSADMATHRCEVRCSLGTYRFNSTPACVDLCPTGYADQTTRTCVATCPLWADTFGYHNMTSGQRLCVTECPANLFAEAVGRTCGPSCSGSTYAYNGTNQCVSQCIDSFADPHNNRCMDSCNSLSYPNADNSTNMCVALNACSSNPDYYADNNRCVYYCSGGKFAQPIWRTCEAVCANTSGLVFYGDVTTGRCVLQCPQGYYAHNQTNKCVPVCLAGSFGHNRTRTCLDVCPAGESLYGDPLTHMCAYTCSGGRFASDISQQCEVTCDADTWGDPLSTRCVSRCPDSVYMYGQNTTWTCVASCVGFTGYADNFTRTCRDICQNITGSLVTFAYDPDKTCLEMCPDGFFRENSTRSCQSTCSSGFADNFTRYCVSECPDDPETYGATISGKNVCVYECPPESYSDNTTNLCVPVCPSGPDYFGDATLGRCVKFCSEGTWAQTDAARLCRNQCSILGQFADNLTRRCVTDCPASQVTFADGDTKRCVRLCSPGTYALNQTRQCVPTCLNDAIDPSIYSYADNITRFCVLVCPWPDFGRNDTNRCVPECPLNHFGHHQGRICVTELNCYDVFGVMYFADDISKTCVQKCPLTRWADIPNRKCLPACPPSFYRNNNDQTCVSNCPSTPDEYIDTIAGTCVRKCDVNYYAVVRSAPPNLRQCITDCQTEGLINNNITRRCVPLTGCPTNPFMFGDPLLNKCVLFCSGGYFADNRTQTCVPVCPASWQLFGSTATMECVSLCEPNTFADKTSTPARQCRTSCSNGYFTDNETSTCVQHCSEIKPFYYEYLDVIQNRCVEVCPGETYAHDVDQKCYPTVAGVSTCPPGYFADTLSKRCVTLCPLGKYADSAVKYCVDGCTGTDLADNQTRTCATSCSDHTFALGNSCVQFCPAPFYANNATKSCVVQADCPILAVPSTRSCEAMCPPPLFARFDLKLCVESINCNPKFADWASRQCKDSCLLPSYSNTNTFTCDLVCPDGTFGRQVTNSCSLTCNIGFADPTTRRCVDTCPQNPMLFAYSVMSQCLPGCPPPKFAFEPNRTCLDSCPTVGTQIFLADSSVDRCVLQCINELLSYADYTNNVCTDFCPPNSYASNETKQCVPTCPNSPVDTFADNFTRICRDICPDGHFGYTPDLRCVDQCWLPYFGQPVSRKCVRQCPPGSFAQNETARCVPTCQPGTYADPTTHRCVAQCPAISDLFKFQNWTCLADCPDGYFANRNTSSCVRICNSTEGMYAFQQTNTCVMECPFPFRGYDVDHVCVLSCPSNYFYNITRNLCTKCPDECLTCTSPTTCLTCALGFNLFSGACSSSCRPNGNIITWLHPVSNICVTSCPFGSFARNDTYACAPNCPAQQFGNNQTNMCQNCPTTCSLCTSLTRCTACQTNATLAIDFMCYSNCNSTYRFYNGAVCVLSCPNNTYLSYTGVHCLSCSDLCATCSGAASSCTSCRDRYLYNGACVSMCPSGFFGASNFTCQSCDSSSASICNNPLNFTTSVAIQNFQYVVTVKFNQNVSIEKQIQQILKVQLKVSRRVLSAADLINNGVSYTYQILSDGTIKLYLNLQTDLVNPVFTVRFTDPTAVRSLTNGATLQDIDSDFTIDKIEYYPPSEAEEIGIRKASLFAVVFIMLLYAATVFFTDVMVRPVQMLQLMFFHCATSVPFPASFLFFMVELKPSLLFVLPNWLRGPIPVDLTVHTSSSQRTIDIFTDYNFFRNVGQILFMIVIALGLWGLFLILSNRRIVENKIWHNMLLTISVRRFRFSLLNDIVGVFYLPILWFGFNQFQELFGSGYYGFNGFICLVFVIFCLLYPAGLLLVWWKKPKEEISENLPFMSNRINLDKQKGLLESPLTYFYLLLSAIWLVGLDKQSVPQMVLLILTNAAYICYLVIVKPFAIHVNTLVGIVWCILLIVVEGFLLYFSINNASLTSTMKTNTIFPLLVTLSVFLMLLVIWSLWRSIWQLMDIWQFFKTTDFYKHFGDPEVEEQSAKSEVYERYEKVAVAVEPTIGDVIIEQVVRECKETGENVIKVRKKVLKKKKKVKKGVKNEEPIEQSEPDSDDKQYVRINRVNPFDYDYDQDFKVKPKKQPMKRIFDDDIRDNEEEEYQADKKKQSKPIKQSKHAKLPQIKNPRKKLFVAPEQKMLKDINQLYDIKSEGSELELKSQKSQSKDSGLELISEASDKTLIQGQDAPYEGKQDVQKREESIQQSEIVPELSVKSPREQKKQQQSQRYDVLESDSQIASQNNLIEEPSTIPKDTDPQNQHHPGKNHWEIEDQSLYEHQKLQPPSRSNLAQSQKPDSELASLRSQEPSAEVPLVPAAKRKGLEQLLYQQQTNKKKKLLFLFEDEQA